jgi:hypothetical protein
MRNEPIELIKGREFVAEPFAFFFGASAAKGYPKRGCGLGGIFEKSAGMNSDGS